MRRLNAPRISAGWERGGSAIGSDIRPAYRALRKEDGGGELRLNASAHCVRVDLSNMAGRAAPCPAPKAQKAPSQEWRLVLNFQLPVCYRHALKKPNRE
jgi:hypothetical protein